MDDINRTGYEHEALLSPGGEWREWWPSWSELLKHRLDAGFKAYGDRSFNEDPSKLLDMIAEEAADLANWSYIAWVRVQKLKAKLAKVRALHGGLRADLHDHHS